MSWARGILGGGRGVLELDEKGCANARARRTDERAIILEQTEESRPNSTLHWGWEFMRIS